MTKAEALQAALLELLEEASASPTQLRQRLEAAGIPLRLETVSTTLQCLQRLGKVIHCDDGAWLLASRLTPMAAPAPTPEPTETTMATKTCPKCSKTKPDSEFVKNGKCKECNRAYMRQFMAKAKGAKSKRAPKASPAPAPASKTAAPRKAGSVRVEQVFTIDIDDVGGKTHTLQLSHTLACELHEALEEFVS